MHQKRFSMFQWSWIPAFPQDLFFKNDLFERWEARSQFHKFGLDVQEVKIFFLTKIFLKLTLSVPRSKANVDVGRESWDSETHIKSVSQYHQHLTHSSPLNQHASTFDCPQTWGFRWKWSSYGSRESVSIMVSFEISKSRSEDLAARLHSSSIAKACNKQNLQFRNSKVLCMMQYDAKWCNMHVFAYWCAKSVKTLMCLNNVFFATEKQQEPTPQTYAHRKEFSMFNTLHDSSVTLSWGWHNLTSTASNCRLSPVFTREFYREWKFFNLDRKATGLKPKNINSPLSVLRMHYTLWYLLSIHLVLPIEATS